MAFLSTFEYDVFLSYGWAGNRTTDEGDRHWINTFKRLFEERLRTKLGRDPNIFVDSLMSRSGDLLQLLESTVEGSAFLLFAASPGSCRKDSWCNVELRQFLGRARPLASANNVLTPEDRLLGVTFEPVPFPDLPPLLRRIGFRSYDLYEQLESGITEPADLEKPSALVAGQFGLLVEETYRRIKEAEKILAEAKPPGEPKTVFFGSAPTDGIEKRYGAALRRDLLMRGYRVISDEPITAETEDDYRLRIGANIERAHLSVHLLNDECPGMPGWETRPIIWQLRKAGQALNVPVFTWVDPDVALDPAAKKELADYPKEGGHHFEKAGIESFKSAILKRLETPAASAASEASEAGPGKAEGKLVVVAYDNDDLKRAGGIAQHLNRAGFKTRLAMPPGKEPSVRKKKNAEYFKEADGVVVYFGDTNELWVASTCDQITDCMGGHGYKAVVVGPPPGAPPEKEFMEVNSDSNFKYLRTESDADASLLDALLLHLRGVPAAQSTGAGQ